jgi:hypothetical protein
MEVITMIAIYTPNCPTPLQVAHGRGRVIGCNRKSQLNVLRETLQELRYKYIWCRNMMKHVKPWFPVDIPVKESNEQYSYALFNILQYV